MRVTEGVSKRSLCEVASELRCDLRNQLRHSRQVCIRQNNSQCKGGNEIGRSEGLKGGQYAWNKLRGGECDGRWDWASGMGRAGHGRSLGFILNVTETHWRALNRTNLNCFDSTKVLLFHRGSLYVIFMWSLNSTERNT